jgi:DNA repair exonuclease SbcCD nuclease subunit
MADAIQVLHAGDLHIDSPLGGLVSYDGAPVDDIRGATRRAAENLIAHAIDEGVDLVVLAGDIFDGEWKDFNTGLFWVGQLSRLHEAGIPVVLVAGNHDAASEISRNLTLPPLVTTLDSTKAERKVFDDFGLAVVGQSYPTRSVTADLAAGFPQADPGIFTLGLLHTSLDGRPGHANYAPCSLERLRSLGYGYWALGHIHQREIICIDPYVVFPGNLQGRHIRETGGKGATRVVIESQEVTAVEHVDLDAVRWHICEVDASELSSLEEVLVEIDAGLASIVETSSPRVSAARVVISGRSRAHAALWRDPHGLLADVRAAGLIHGRLWVEKVDVRTESALEGERARSHGAVRLLVERLTELKSHPELLGEYESLFADLRRKIGADARSSEGAVVDTRQIGTAEHIAARLDTSLELVVSLLAEVEP